ncbi:hypothetical protein SSX86_019849 [Deinandra increscens subsp. villosa]|uniref:Peptidase M10 metallopeptidase domain-containing protein n=1 Tax=Deinandra increscens subsp. villosa TaxID=3103831 RepID=A0AAP0CY56_9ASTR
MSPKAVEGRVLLSDDFTGANHLATYSTVYEKAKNNMSDTVKAGHRRDLTYAFNPGNQLSDDVIRVFVNAIVRWSDRTPLMFTEPSSNNFADLKIGFFVGDHGYGEAADGVLGTLAHTFAPAAGLLHLDSYATWIISDV